MFPSATGLVSGRSFDPAKGLHFILLESNSGVSGQQNVQIIDNFGIHRPFSSVVAVANDVLPDLTIAHFCHKSFVFLLPKVPPSFIITEVDD